MIAKLGLSIWFLIGAGKFGYTEGYKGKFTRSQLNSNICGVCTFVTTNKKKKHQPGFKTWYAFGIPRNKMRQSRNTYNSSNLYFEVTFAFPLVSGINSRLLPSALHHTPFLQILFQKRWVHFHNTRNSSHIASRIPHVNQMEQKK